ncbi:MAG: GNAT family N-acetyltransferase [Mangrovicoccus sp.]
MSQPEFEVRLAQTPEEIAAAQELRYQVFVEELGSDGPMVDHVNRREIDQFDPDYDHMLLLDHARGAVNGLPVIGVYRLLRSDQVDKIGKFYTEDEYDLSVLKNSGRRLLELGRSCLHAEYRGGAAMYHLWNGLAQYTLEHQIDILFGVASFHGTDPQALAEQLSLLHYRHMAPPDLRVRTIEAQYQPLNLLPEDQIDRARAVRDIPALIKAYLRLGGYIGDGAFIDHAFNTVDVCLILDTDRMNDRQRAIYTRGLSA